MAQDNAGSVNGVVIRVTSLNADGTKAVGASASYVTKAFIQFTITPEIEAGTDITQKGADGQPCVTYKTADTLKRVNLSVALCDPDPEFTEKISGGSLLTAAGNSKGWAAPLVGVDPTPNGVAVEVWSRAVKGGKSAGTEPYWHWLVPYAVFRQTGDRVIQEGLLATEFTGWGTGNSAFVSPAAPTWPYVTDRPYAYARSATIPTTTGYVASV
jgi:hypothetical protein